MLKLDWTLKTPEERTKYVEELLKEIPKEQQTNKLLEILSDYIFKNLTKEEKKSRTILTDNRMVTVNKREISYEGLAERLENGEEGIYNLTSTLGKGARLTPKIEITEQDIEEVPYLKELRSLIDETIENIAPSRGKRRYYLKKKLADLYRDQYVLKNDYYQPIRATKITKNSSYFEFDENIYFDEDGLPQSDGYISLFNPKHVAVVFANYENIKNAAAASNFRSNLWFFLQDLNKLIDKVFREKNPLYFDLFLLKAAGVKNVDVQEELVKKYNIHYSIEYISSLWCKKLPKMIAEQAQEDYLIWYYTYVEYGKWKKCSRCGQIKLAHNRFFSKNNASKDGFYSICKECRNSTTKKKGE